MPTPSCRASLVALAVAIAVTLVPAAAAEVSQFRDYPATVYGGRSAPLRLDAPDVREYRSLFEEAASQPVNFAGHYILVEWGAGTGCRHGGVIDVRTGAAQLLPHAACFWNETGAPFYYRADSRLIVFGGKLGEIDPAGAHFLIFDGSGFTLLRSVAE